MRGTDWLWLWALSLLWGGSFLFVELALAGLPPLTVVWGRVGLAALILWGVVRLRRTGGPPREVWPALLVMGLLNNAVPFTLFALAQGQISGALASVLNATTPIFTVLVAHLATVDERLGPARALGVGLGFSGVVVMLADGGMAGTRLALLAGLGAALSYGLASVWGRRFRAAGLSPLTTAVGQVTASSLLLLPAWLLVDRPWALGWPGTGPVLAVLGLATLSTAVAYLIFFKVLASAGATAISLVTFLIPISAMGLGWLVLGETLEPQQIAGLGLVLLGLGVIDGRLMAEIVR
ncbi:MAG: EamA family transporter [Rhodobacter sp.]|nr:EamA family transporter [Rhodobacter sp.]